MMSQGWLQKRCVERQRPLFRFLMRVAARRAIERGDHESAESIQAVYVSDEKTDELRSQLLTSVGSEIGIPEDYDRRDRIFKGDGTLLKIIFENWDKMIEGIIKLITAIAGLFVLMVMVTIAAASASGWEGGDDPALLKSPIVKDFQVPPLGSTVRLEGDGVSLSITEPPENPSGLAGGDEDLYPRRPGLRERLQTRREFRRLRRAGAWKNLRKILDRPRLLMVRYRL